MDYTVKTSDIVSILNELFCPPIKNMILEYDYRFNKQCIKDRAIAKKKRQLWRKKRYPLKLQHMEDTSDMYFDKLLDYTYLECDYDTILDHLDDYFMINKAVFEKYENILIEKNKQWNAERKLKEDERIRYFKTFKIIKDLTPPPRHLGNGMISISPNKYLYYSSEHDVTYEGYIIQLV